MPIWKRETWDGGESWGLEAQHLVELDDRRPAVGAGVMSNAGFLLHRRRPAASPARCWSGLFNRKPKTFMSSIDDFYREMKALGRDADEPHGSRRRKRPHRPRPPIARPARAPIRARPPGMTTARPDRRPGRSRGAAAIARDLAIDLGTANTLVYAAGEGIVLNEPSVIALNSRTQDVLAMGHEAWQMIGRTPSYIVAVRPLRKGAITDFEITQRMIRLLLQRVGVSRFNRPRVVICVPSAITAVERRAVIEAAKRAGASEAHLIEQPMAAAIGAGLPINEPMGNMVVDIGGGTSETALISLGGVVALEAVRVGSFDIDAHIQTYIRREYGIAIGERTAEEIKVTIGSAWPTEDEYAAEVRGRELMSGLPKTVVLSAEEVREAIDEPVSAMVDSVVACLGQAPPELAQDLIIQGIHLVGGGGMLRGLDLRLAQETEIPVHLVDAPARVRGARRRPLHRGLRRPQGHVHGLTRAPLSAR